MTSKASKLHAAGDAPGRDAAPFRLVYVPDIDETAPRQGEAYVLGEVRFGSSRTPARRPDPDYPLVCVPIAQLWASPIKEYWLSPTPVDRRRQAGIQISANDHVLFGHTQFTLPATGAELEREIRQRYDAILELLGAQGYDHLMRMWNYLPRISDDIDGMECYRRFCRARYDAFETFHEELIPNLPATSVLGTSGVDFQIVFLAGRSSPRHYENPRQVSAYHYPRKYGPKSPLFARATLVRWNREDSLFISGTASIVGHESQHLGNARAQAEEILRNIESLVNHVAASANLATRGLREITHLRVYLRDAKDLETVRRVVQGYLGTTIPAIYLHAGICRRELLVEMEAFLGVEKLT